MTYEEFAAKRKLLQMKYDGNLTLAENLQNLDDSLTGTKDVALASFINAAVKQAIGLEESIYEFMGGNTKAARDVIVGKCGVMGIGGKHDEILGKNGPKYPYGPHDQFVPSMPYNKPLYRLDRNNTCRGCMHRCDFVCGLRLPGGVPIPVVSLNTHGKVYYRERCIRFRELYLPTA